MGHPRNMGHREILLAQSFMQLPGARRHLWKCQAYWGLRGSEEAGSIRKSSSSHVPGAMLRTTNPALSVDVIKDEPGLMIVR